MSTKRRLMLFAGIIFVPILLVAAILVAGDIAGAEASSHREAPSISKDQFADNTDTYVWIPQGQTDTIVLAASWIPFEGPEGGPNYFEWDDDVAYYLYVDIDGDASPEVTYTLQSRVEMENPDTFLYNTGPINSISDATWNRKQYVTVEEYFEPGLQPGARAPDAHVQYPVTDSLTAPVNIGSKSTPDWASLREEATYTWNDPRNGDELTVYAGPTDDAFWVDLQVFDLLTLRGQEPPIGYSSGNNTPVDSLSGYNVHSLIIEMPISHLTRDGEPVLGVWAASGRVGGPVLQGENNKAPDAHTQVSRLGMPLVNEVVLPLGLKDTFNTIPPSADLGVYGALQESVEDPEVGNLLCGLYGVPLPDDSNDDCESEYTEGTPRSARGDIFDIFLQGMVLANPFTITTADGPTQLPAGFNVNRPMTVTPSEMIRINTAISGDLCHPTPQRLGVLAGDACGFPNGRRPMDDVIDIELLAVAGAAYEVLDDRDDSFSFNSDLIAVLDDGLDGNDVGFQDSFPYFADAQSGQSHFHQNADAPPMALSFGNMTVDASSAPWLHIVAGLLSLGIVGAFEWMRRRRQ